MMQLCSNLMKRTGFGAVMGIAGFPLSGNAAEESSSSGVRPNVIVILADDLGHGDLGCYGATKIKTPNIDRLAKEGRSFNFAYASSAVCSPSRYGLLSGRYHWRTPRHPRSGTHAPSAPLLFEPGRATLATLFKQNGYATACIGKWHQGFGEGDDPALQFDWSQAAIKPGPLEAGFDYFFGIAANILNEPRMYIENHRFYNREPFEPSRVPGEMTGKAIEFIERNRDRPFFIYYASTIPHEPIVPSEDFIGKSECGLYGDVVQELDSNVGEILDALQEAGILENTLILFTSDNGAAIHTPAAPEAMRIRFKANLETRLAGHLQNGLLRGGKQSAWEGGFRVPFIVRWPGEVPAGTQSDAVLCLTDVFATFAAMLDVKVPENAGEDSFNALPVWRGEPDAFVRDTLVLQSGIGNFAIRRDHWKLILRDDSDPRYHRVAWNQNQLYNLAEDPFEETNLWNRYPEVVNELSGLLEKKLADRPDRP